MNLDGVRSVNFIKIVQNIKGTNLYRYSIFEDGSIIDEAGDSGGTTGYGYKYAFEHSHDTGIVLPPHPNNPAVFELINPKQNIQGVVL